MKPPPSKLYAAVLTAAAVGCLVGLAAAGPRSNRASSLEAKPAASSTPAKAKPPGQAPSSKSPTTAQHRYPLPVPKGHGGTAARPGSAPGTPRGPAGPAGPQGPPGPVSDVVRSLTLNWRNGASGADPTSSATLPVGTVTITCTFDTQTLTVTPAAGGVRTVLATDTVQGAGTQGAASFARATSDSPGSPITVPLPNNGMILGTLSVEPFTGDGGPGPDPTTMTLSAESILNDPVAANNFCFVAAQFVGKP